MSGVGESVAQPAAVDESHAVAGSIVKIGHPARVDDDLRMVGVNPIILNRVMLRRIEGKLIGDDLRRLLLSDREIAAGAEITLLLTVRPFRIGDRFLENCRRGGPDAPQFFRRMLCYIIPKLRRKLEAAACGADGRCGDLFNSRTARNFIALRQWIGSARPEAASGGSGVSACGRYD
jgi:hypothetical protein